MHVNRINEKEKDGKKMKKVTKYNVNQLSASFSSSSAM